MFVETQGYRGKNEESCCLYLLCLRCGLLVLICWVAAVLISYLILHNNLVAGIAIIYFLLINIITLSYNYYDKKSAEKRRTFDRVPEKDLHFLSLVGGAPATALSMFIFNHKSTKSAYQYKYLVMCLFNFIWLVVALAIIYLVKNKIWLSLAIKQDL